MSTLLEAALAYAAAGFPVFPLIVGGKDPDVARGFYAATTNPETVKRFWRIPDRNIGIRTGVASGVWVVDLDPPDGEDNIRRLEADHGQLPPTRTVRTPRGGRHLWFKYVDPVPSSVGRIADHVDVRADGGYVAVAPSITAAGTYSWLGDPKAKLATAPSWLLDLARKKPKPTISKRAVAGIQNAGWQNPDHQTPTAAPHSTANAPRSRQRRPDSGIMRSTARPSGCISSLPAVRCTVMKSSSACSMPAVKIISSRTMACARSRRRYAAVPMSGSVLRARGMGAHDNPASLSDRSGR
jgi:hypothetical protein